MQNIPAKLHLSDLLNSKIVTDEGQVLGHVADISLSPGPEYKVIGFLYGLHGWIYRLHVLNPFHPPQKLPQLPDAIPWQAIASIEDGTIKLKPGFHAQKGDKGF